MVPEEDFFCSVRRFPCSKILNFRIHVENYTVLDFSLMQK
jgi:hypothetical protein